MPTNIKANDITKKELDTIEKELQISAVRSSKVSDSKNIFKSEEKEKAFKRRYKQDVRITISYELDGKNLKEITLQFQDSKNKVYALTEYFKENQTTDYVILSCRRKERNFEYKFDRFLDAEVSMIDIMTEE
jgi:hypothetical protein